MFNDLRNMIVADINDNTAKDNDANKEYLKHIQLLDQDYALF